MKILSAEVSNFGSYKHLRFEFDNLGLTLVSGPTGAGKSTILDIVPWVLFGCTAKNGSVEDVRSWQAEGEPTTGSISVDCSGRGQIQVVRTRLGVGKGDLYWTESGSAHCNRGKDLNDTQKLLEARLGVSTDTYLSATYFHEFSPVGSIFTAKAKDRRELFERLADLSFPARLSANAGDLRKSGKTDADVLRVVVAKLEGRAGELERSGTSTRKAAESWNLSQKGKIEALKVKAASFEADKAATIASIQAKSVKWTQDKEERTNSLQGILERLQANVKDSKQLDLEEARVKETERCNQCGSLPESVNETLRKYLQLKVNNTHVILDVKAKKAELKQTLSSENPYTAQLASALTSENTYDSAVVATRAEENHFLAQIQEIEAELVGTYAELADRKEELSALESKLSRLTRLIELSSTLRGELLRKSVREIETQTNSYLEKYFDAEIRIGFSAGDADNIEVSIHKSGYECNYKQLSRGQRSLLRLCFAVSVMKAAANAAGHHFDLLAFDECLDGQSVDLKVKAVSLFESLGVDHSTVLVIDHCTEVKSQFTREYKVEMIGDISQISETV